MPYLIFDERDLLLDAVHHEFQLKLQVLACEYRIIVFLHIRCLALDFCCNYVAQSCFQTGYPDLNLLDFDLLLLNADSESTRVSRQPY